MVDAKIRLTFSNETDLKIKPQTCLDTLVSLSTFYVCFWRIFSLHAVLDGGFLRINLELKKKLSRRKRGVHIPYTLLHIQCKQMISSPLLFLLLPFNPWRVRLTLTFKKRDSYPANFGVKIQIVILGSFLKIVSLDFWRENSIWKSIKVNFLRDFMTYFCSNEIYFLFSLKRFIFMVW